MKRTIQLLLICVLPVVVAQQAWSQASGDDIVYLKNGGIMRGRLLEVIPDQSVKLQTSDGNVFVYRMSEVERIAKASDADMAAETHNKMESWYLCFALGYADPAYPGAVQAQIDQVRAGGSHASASVDVPGVYWPLGNGRTVIGGTVNVVVDTYNATLRNDVEISEGLIGFSAMHFLTAGIGEGVFLRGDLGIASLRMRSFDGSLDRSDGGVGILLGAGYALPVSSETRLLLQTNFASRSIANSAYRAWSFTLGVML